MGERRGKGENTYSGNKRRDDKRWTRGTKNNVILKHEIKNKK